MGKRTWYVCPRYIFHFGQVNDGWIFPILVSSGKNDEGYMDVMFICLQIWMVDSTTVESLNLY
jgi:hypothetical protein